MHSDRLTEHDKLNIDSVDLGDELGSAFSFASALRQS